MGPGVQVARVQARVLGSVLVLCSLSGGSAFAQIAMPDSSQIAGRAIPAPELPDGTVSVRLVRESLGNNIVGHEVKVTAGAVSRTGTTDDTGRAAIAGLPGGASATAEAVVDGERVVSDPFDVPARGGIRVILISGVERAAERKRQAAEAEAKAPPVKGAVVLGGDTRFIFEFQEDTLRGFYLLDIVNTARAPVDTGGPLLIDLPRGAVSTGLLQGSFPGATVSGDRVTIRGPFPPGRTSVQIAYRLLYSGSEASVEQRFPVNLERVSVIVEKLPGVHVSSPQFTNHGDVRSDDGTPLILASGGALAAGTPLALQLTGLPHVSTWPRNVALGLALLIVGAGAWLAFGGRTQADERRRLQARRDSLLGELVKLEEQHRAGRTDAGRYQAKRQQLVAELERIYGELDAEPSAAA
jgi:hypothetical protein